MESRSASYRYRTGHTSSSENAFDAILSEWTSKDVVQYILPVVMVVFGIPGSFCLAKSISKAHGRLKTTGEILGFSTSQSLQGHAFNEGLWVANISYEVDGEHYLYTSKGYKDTSNLGEIGDEIELLYKLENPANVIEGSFNRLWTVPFVLLSLTVLVCLIYTIAMIQSENPYRRPLQQQSSGEESDKEEDDTEHDSDIEDVEDVFVVGRDRVDNEVTMV